MNRAFAIAIMLLISPLPAMGQGARAGDERDSSYARRDRDLDDMLRGVGEGPREFRRGSGAAFFFRSGDAAIGVRCDAQESMRACVEATITLMDRARSMHAPGGSPGGSPGGPGASPGASPGPGGPPPASR